MATQTQTEAASQPIRAAASSSIPHGPVSASLNFFSPPADGSTPFNYVEQQPEGQPQRNFDDSTHDVTINDVRGHESDFSLDKQGFAAITNVPASSETAFEDDASIKEKYYPEVERLLLDNLPGAKRIFFFDHTVRRARPGSARNPVNRVHIDQTTKSAAERVRFHLPDEAEELLKGRVRLVNVWRPINGPVESSPLAFADSSSVPDDSLVGIEHRYPDRTGETAAVKYGEQQRWYYWSGINDQERVLLQCFDNRGTNARVPHSAFVDHRSTEHSKPRESIEVRTLVFG